MDQSQNLSSFVYYRKDESELNIDIRMGSLLNEKCDAIAFTVDHSLNVNGGLAHKVATLAGGVSTFKNILNTVKNGRKNFNSGEVVCVDLTGVQNQNNWKAVLLVVVPVENTMLMSYRTVLEKCVEYRLDSVSVVGLGCGQIGISAKTSAKKFFEAITKYDSNNVMPYPNSISAMDVQRGVVSAFVTILNEYVDDMRYIQENKSKLVCVENQNIFEYEARRLTMTVAKEKIEDGDCVVCLCELKGDDEVCCLKCDHQFHYDCFKNYLKQCTTRKCCPVCRTYFSVPCGNQPENATMHIRSIGGVLEGHEGVSTRIIEIQYTIPGGVQDDTHLRPGVPFKGTTRIAYLPDSPDGRKVLRMLKKAFECRLTFTVGDSVTTGVQNVVTWNSIHHKTNLSGGPAHFGYPDPTYFVRVLAELEESGITEDLLSEDANVEHHPNIIDNS